MKLFIKQQRNYSKFNENKKVSARKIDERPYQDERTRVIVGKGRNGKNVIYNIWNAPKRLTSQEIYDMYTSPNAKKMKELFNY